MGSDHGWSSTRSLAKSQLGGVIFGAKKTTFNECLSRQLFGLPSPHFTYVKKIDPGLPLFLFNYTDRTLHGIFEAASSGKMNIDPYAWTSDGSQRTPYPAQVQIRVKMQCRALAENQFKPIIIDNYYSQNLFWFELDHAQTNRLLSLLSSQPYTPPRATFTPHGTMKQTAFSPSENERACYMPLEVSGGDFSNTNGGKNLPNDKEMLCMKLKELALKSKLVGPSSDNYTPKVKDIWPKLVGQPSAANREDEIVVKDVIVEPDGSSSNKKKEDGPKLSEDHSVIITQLIKKVDDLMVSKAAQDDKINLLEQKIASMEENLAEAEVEIMNLKALCKMPKASASPQEFDDDIEDQERETSVDGFGLADESILLVGGYDGASWLASLDRYSPSQTQAKSLETMNTERCYAAVSKLDGELFVFGGGTRGQWFDTVESYDPVMNQWKSWPPLNRENGSLAGATVNDKIYAVGGGNGVDCYSAVEMLDFDVGAWIPTRSMLQKRFALAAAELNGALYAVGGYDGKSYLSTAERFDPREHSWKKIESMNTMRGCPSMVVLNERLYVLGGYDGNAMVPSVEIYDPRWGSWTIGETMKHPRGFSAAAVANERIYVFGGLKSGEEINETVECYKVGRGWELANANAACRRCFFSAIAL